MKSLSKYRQTAIPAGCAIAVFLAVCFAFAPAAWASIRVLGPADDLSLDQPRVTFGLIDHATQTLVGPLDFNSAALDTGANGIVLATAGYIDPNTGLVNPNTYAPATRGDGSVVQYQEIGIGGTEMLTLFQPYDLQIQPHPLDLTGAIELTGITAFGSPTLDLGDFGGIVGMPAMTGRIVSVDLTPMLNYDLIHVDFPSTLPASTPGSYHVALTAMPPEYTAPQQPGDPRPTFSALHEIDGITTGDHAKSSVGSMILDTGAQVSMISSATADALGIDWHHTIAEGGDVEGTLPVGGVGGTASIPEVRLNYLDVPTTEGVDLQYTNVLVGVLDIPGVNGIFGVNMLTSGYLAALAGTGEGYFNDFVLNFTDPNASILRLDVNPDLPNNPGVPLPEPTSIMLLVLGCAMILLTRRGHNCFIRGDQIYTP